MRRLSATFILGLALMARVAAPGHAAEATGSLGGRVLAADSGRPLSGVLVTAYSDARGDARAATTNAQGVYAIGGLPAGRYFVDFTCPEGSRYASEAMFVEKGVNRGGGRETTVESGRTRFLEQRLELGAELELRFVDDAGLEWNPADSGSAPNLTIVEDYPDGAQRRLVPSATLHEGPLRRVVFQGLPRSSGATVLVQVPGHLGLNPPAARLNPGERTAVVVRLDRGDPTGVEGWAPPGARVVVVSEPEGRQVAEMGADNDGRFSITGFYPGLYGMRVNGLPEGLVDIVKGQRAQVDLRYADLAAQRPLLPVLPPLPPDAPDAGGPAVRTLDVVVRDGSGKILRDLRSEEIEVYEDGVRRELKGLRHIDGPLAPAGSGALLTVVVDLVSAQGWVQAMTAATELVNRLPPETPVAALRLGNGVFPLLPTTSDRAAALGALSLEPPKLGLGAAAAESPCPMTAAAVRNARSFGLQLRDHRAIYGLLSIVEAQAALPGRKLLAYLCEGFALSSEHEAAFRSLIAAANRAGVSLYVIDLRGMNAEEQLAVAQAELASAETTPQAEGTAGAPDTAAADAAVADWKTLLQARANERAVVEELASGTGGFVIANRDLLERGLGWIADDLGHYDELVYEPNVTTSSDAAYRYLKVRVTRPGARVQHRDGYAAVVPLGGGPLLTYEIPLLRALADAAPREDLALHLSTLRFGAAGAGIRVAWLGEMRRADITFASTPGVAELRARVAFLTLVRDAQGVVILRRSRALPLVGTRERLAELAQQRIQFVEHAVLPPGEYTLEAAMLDEQGGRVAVQRQRLELSAPRAGLGLSSLVVASGFMTPSQSDPADPLQVRSFRVVPSGDGSARREPGAVTIPIYCVVYPLAQAEPPDFDVEVLREGRVVSSGSVRLPAPDNLGAIRHVSSVPLERLRDGVYEVRVRVTQEGHVAERVTALDLGPMPSRSDPATLRVVEQIPIQWPEARPTRRVLLDDKEEKVALGIVPPASSRGFWSRKKIALVAALAGAGGAVALRDRSARPHAFKVISGAGIANLTEFVFEYTGGGDRSCNWDFGDGATAVGTRVTHVYRREGVYQVTVTGATRGTEQVEVATLYGFWLLRDHRFRIPSYSGSALTIQCDDRADAEVRWTCELQGSLTAPDQISASGPWVEEDRTTGRVESKPVAVLQGQVESSDRLWVTFDGSVRWAMERVNQ